MKEVNCTNLKYGIYQNNCSAVQSEKRRRAIRARNESSDDEEKKGKEEKKKGEMKEIEHSRDRRDNGDRRDERKSDLRYEVVCSVRKVMSNVPYVGPRIIWRRLFNC